MEYIRRRKRYHIKGHRSGAGFVSLLRWQLGGGKAKWPRKIENAAHEPPPLHVYGNALRATWIGHSTVLLQTGGVNILTDPFLARRASPLRFAGPKRVRAAAHFPGDMPPIDIVLVSHNHYDHLDRPGLKRLLKDHNPVFVTLTGNKRFIKTLRSGLDINELDWREQFSIGDFTITAMPALHWSKRTFDDANMALWGAFVIDTPGGIIYFAGDTGFGNGGLFEEVRERFGPPRLSLLPIGAYEPRWFMKSMHMNPDDAVRAHQLLASQTSFAIHHGTIQLTNEGIDQPVIDLRAALDIHGVSEDAFLALDTGEGVDVI
jgi:L-ascorbate metabolism protein UlaG (beta-lactamase superfamily)